MSATLEQPRSVPPAMAPAFANDPGRREIPTTSVLTLILWIGCLTVGWMGVVLPYARPVAPPKPAPPVKAEILQVELTNDPLPPIVSEPKLSLSEPPPLTQPLAPAEVPPMTAVAEPSAVAFALPVEGPVVLVEPARASFAAAPVVEKPAPAPAPPVQKLTYGQGEGRQPAPEYPLRARREGQEGVVAIRFSVGEDGRVLAAEAVSPCPWKLLNDSALHVVRERWRFSSGAIRLYEVAIRFQLTK
jgi:TonB family protein